MSPCPRPQPDFSDETRQVTEIDWRPNDGLKMYKGIDPAKRHAIQIKWSERQGLDLNLIRMTFTANRDMAALIVKMMTVITGKRFVECQEGRFLREDTPDVTSQ